MRNIRIASVQFEHQPGDKQANFAKIETFVETAAGRGVEIIAFPECCITGYWYLRNLSRVGMEAIAEPVPDGPSTQRLLALSRKHAMTIGAGLIEITPDGLLHKAWVAAMPDGQWRRGGNDRILYQPPALDPTYYAGRPIQIFSVRDMLARSVISS